MKWFGQAPFGPRFCIPEDYVKTPVGDWCLHCLEPFCDADYGVYVIWGDSRSADQAMHYACWMRGIIGSISHIEHKCSCYIKGGTDTDPLGLTRRQAAEAALAAWEAQERLNVFRKKARSN